jgi:hypothetical protein
MFQEFIQSRSPPCGTAPCGEAVTPCYLPFPQLPHSKMTTNDPSPATKTYCVYADYVNRAYQEVTADSPERAFETAEAQPDGWQNCFEFEDRDAYRLSHDVQDSETREFFRLGSPARCKSCAIAIAEGVSDSVFRDGECGGREARRYRSQPALLETARRLYRLIDGLRAEGSSPFDGHAALLEHCATTFREHDAAA